MGSGKTNKLRGHNGERYYATYFRNLGFEFCETSRAASRKHDNAKIDLVYIPYNIQIKTGKHSNMSPGKELFNMESAIKLMFPQGDEVFKRPCLLIHRKYVEVGQKRKTEDDIIYMSLRQFDFYRNQGAKFEYLSLKEFKFELDSEFKTIVSVTMEDFRNQVILKEQNNVSSRDTITD